MSQIYIDPKTGIRHEFPDDATPEEIDAATQPKAAAQPSPSSKAKVPFFGDSVTVDPSAQPGEWRMRSLAGGGEPGKVEEFTRAGLTLPANLMAGMRAGGAGFKGAARNEQATQVFHQTGRYPNAPRPQPTQPGRLGSAGTTGPGGLALDVAEFLPIVGRIIKAARMGQKVLPTGPGKPVDLNAPAMGGGPVPPGLTRTPVIPRSQAGPDFQPAPVGVAPPRPDATRPLPAWQQPGAPATPPVPEPRLSTAGQAPYTPRPASAQQPVAPASAGVSGRGPEPAQRPSGSQDLPLTRAHRPTGEPVGTPPAHSGPPAMPGPSPLEGVLAKDSVLREALEIARQWRNQHNKGF